MPSVRRDVNSVSESVDIKKKLRKSLNFLVHCINAQYYYPYYRDDINPYLNYPDADGGHENRIFFNQIFNAITSIFTTTTTTTSTSTTTCTVSTNLKCRRKRFLVGDVEAENIEPSVVNKVEVTPLAEMETLVRNERKADQQYPFWRVDPGYPGYPLYDIQSTFGQPAYPVNPYMRPPVVAADPRFFIVNVVTQTSTSTSTFRSTPACSSASNFNQC
ncbi:hypothetical protein DAPPUDRAFT_311006 [Daphnia pulex]|uniref:Uncharacterized protein n=1 Tax=Daphnia pulex TaxID=6669 RepID=E9FUB5_DAPPU|nr:hypothetical protein DAPPUDRAFT_311006 [Daphnia pulex]|eukprot:EFX88695.1 hypothetical protein DAPPUDRAFT_311006 [Daphnia pulex]